MAAAGVQWPGGGAARRCGHAGRHVLRSGAMMSWRAIVDRIRSWPRAAQIGLLVAGVLGILVVAVAIAMPSIVRSMIRERAEARGLEIAIESVSLGFGRVRLSGVTVTDPALPGTNARIDRIVAEMNGLSGRVLRVQGGQVRVVGTAQALEKRLESLRGSRNEEAPSQEGGSSKLAFHVEGIDFVYRESASGPPRVTVWGIRVDRDAGQPMRVRTDLLRAETGRFGAEVKGGAAELAAGGRRVDRLEAGVVDLRVALDRPSSKKAADADPDFDADADADDAPSGPQGPTKLALLAGIGPELSKRLGERFEARAESVRVEVRHRGERVRIGPSLALAKREGGALTFSIAPHATQAGGTPLRARGRVPFDRGAIELDLGGGPVSLAALGIQEGDFGLVGTQQARLQGDLRIEIRPDEQVMEVSSHGRLDKLRLYRPALAAEEIGDIDLAWRGSGRTSLDGSRVVVRDGEVTIGDVRVQLAGEVERTPERTYIKGSGGVPLVPCSSLLAALPHGVAPLLEGMRLDGDFQLSASLEYDSTQPDAMESTLALSNRCRITRTPAAISPDRFRTPWVREVEGENEKPIVIESGPGSPDWTPYEDISPYVETGVIVCEDAGFYRHRGVDTRAMQSALRDNLKAGRFVRGASTVTMQLAKNLYLSREKTLSRKVQEAVLTMLLEQELTKRELMELYLNIVEFGPGIYGVRQAARHYFGVEPAFLTLGQSLFLTSILPRPKARHFRSDGSLNERWAKYLKKLMTIAHKIGRISDEELEAGLAEEIRFQTPGVVDLRFAAHPTPMEEPAPPELEPIRLDEEPVPKPRRPRAPARKRAARPD